MPGFLRSMGQAFTLAACANADAFAGAPQLVFAAGMSERVPSATTVPASDMAEERGLALWGETVSDFGVGVALSGPRWTVRSIDSMTTIAVWSSNEPRPLHLDAIPRIS